ncbi:MAG: hypothetical protein FVQ77_14150 [Cytophagales bacterium]|nr:hypothetical protein [Cytophagales bacterium]
MSQLRFLLDEDVGKRTANILRDKGYEIRTVIEEMPGIKDRNVLMEAVKDKRIVVTLDKDFGRLVFRDHKKYLGVLFLRLRKESPENIASAIQKTVKQYGEQLIGKFTTATEYNVRVR